MATRIEKIGRVPSKGSELSAFDADLAGESGGRWGLYLGRRAYFGGPYADNRVLGLDDTGKLQIIGRMGVPRPLWLGGTGGTDEEGDDGQRDGTDRDDDPDDDDLDDPAAEERTTLGPYFPGNTLLIGSAFQNASMRTLNLGDRLALRLKANRDNSRTRPAAEVSESGYPSAVVFCAVGLSSYAYEVVSRTNITFSIYSDSSGTPNAETVALASIPYSQFLTWNDGTRKLPLYGPSGSQFCVAVPTLVNGYTIGTTADVWFVIGFGYGESPAVPPTHTVKVPLVNYLTTTGVANKTKAEYDAEAATTPNATVKVSGIDFLLYESNLLVLDVAFTTQHLPSIYVDFVDVSSTTTVLSGYVKSYRHLGGYVYELEILPTSYAVDFSGTAAVRFHGLTKYHNGTSWSTISTVTGGAPFFRIA